MPAPARAAPGSEAAAGDPARPAAVASYDLRARLDADAHRVSASGKIAWTNTSRLPVDELWLHLYLNAFKNDRTRFLRSPFRSGRGGKRSHAYGYVDVTRLVLTSTGADLWPAAARHSPDDADDETDIRVPLPVSVEPGARIELEIAFESQLPEIVERTGYLDSYHFVAQWFPKLARLEPDGTFSHFAFDPQSEFYADFGDYRVELDVPAAFVVGATGSLLAERRSADRKELTFAAAGVHDFAWTAWDGFREQRERIADVDVRLLYPDGYGAAATATVDALRFALPDFGRRYGVYPYPTLTVVHPPLSAARSGGMEYPTLITTGGPWFGSLIGLRATEIVTIHELGHQWFYGILASNEHLFPFLDEGFNSYAEGIAVTTLYGPRSIIGFGGLELSVPALRRIGAVERAHAASIATSAPGFASFGDMGALVYSRTAALLSTLAAVYGQERLDRLFAEYSARYRFLHPRPEDFFGVLSEQLGEEAAALARSGFLERGWVDFVAQDLSSVKSRNPAGVFDRDGRREVIAREHAFESDTWVSSVRLYRHGPLVLPVDIELTLEDGTRTREAWDGQGSHRILTHEGPSPITQVELDPDRKIIIDQNLLNNSSAAEQSHLPRLWERMLYVVQLAFGALFS